MTCNVHLNLSNLIIWNKYELKMNFPTIFELSTLDNKLEAFLYVKY